MSLQYEPPAPPPRAPHPVPTGMTDDGATLTLRERPLTLWVMGGFCAAAGLLIVLTDRHGPGLLIGPLLAALGLAAVVGTGVLVVTADRRSRVLTIERRSLAGRFRVEVPFADVRAIVVRTSRSTDSDGESSLTYRTVVVRTEGPDVPFRSWFESGSYGRRRERAQALAAAVGIERPEPSGAP